MAKFLNRFQATDSLNQLISEADRQLILISPYIKLNNYLKEVLNTQKSRPELELIIVYGKNEEDKRKSISDEDYEFFKSFSNISIRYHKRLHAKIYTNDYQCLITSMNLHNYSLNENIETGILTEFRIIGFANNLLSRLAPKMFSDTLDSKALDFVNYIIEKSTIEFERKSIKKSFFFGLTSTFSQGEISINKSRTGYCIHSKQIIPFNPSRPYSKSGYDNWIKCGSFKSNEERYCHKCGKSNKSTMLKPLCIVCYKSS
jgi:hypothetical protein